MTLPVGIQLQTEALVARALALRGIGRDMGYMPKDDPSASCGLRTSSYDALGKVARTETHVLLHAMQLSITANGPDAPFFAGVLSSRLEQGR